MQLNERAGVRHNDFKQCTFEKQKCLKHPDLRPRT